MLRINPNDQINLQLYIERYKIWRDYKNFYSAHKDPVVDVSNDGVDCYHYTHLDAINNSKSKLVVIDNLSESIHSMPMFKQYRKDCKYLIFSAGTWGKDYYDLGIDYEIVYTPYFIYEMADSYLSTQRFCFYLDKTYSFEYPKPFKFVSTIGSVRDTRDYLVNQLVDKIHDQNIILRYSGIDLKNTSHDSDVMTFTPGDFDPYHSLMNNYYHNVSQTLPIGLYNQAYFNLIVESDLDLNHAFFLTEKTIKGLITGMPFVSVASANFLYNLHKLGFKTYNSIWDESYDQIDDYHRRVDAIVDLCNHLCNFDWNKHQQELKQIADHNRLNFLNLNKQASIEFQNFETIIESL